MDKFKLWRDSEPVRLYLYTVLVPALALLVAKGLLTQEDAVYWLAVAGAALGAPTVIEKLRSTVDSPSTARAKDEALEAEVALREGA